MRHDRQGIRFAPALAGLVVLLAACTGDKYQDTVTSGPNPLVGLLEQAPDLSGAWEFSLTTSADTCGIEIFPITGAGAFQVSQTDTAIAFTVLSPCGSTVTTGEGTVGHDGVATFEWEESFVASETCRLTLTTVAAGAGDAAAQTLAGSFTLTVEPADEDQSCSATFPCEISGSFAALECPSAGCEFASCD